MRIHWTFEMTGMLVAVLFLSTGIAEPATRYVGVSFSMVQAADCLLPPASGSLYQIP
jgi:hypothetical protein